MKQTLTQYFIALPFIACLFPFGNGHAANSMEAGTLIRSSLYDGCVGLQKEAAVSSLAGHMIEEQESVAMLDTVAMADVTFVVLITVVCISVLSILLLLKNVRNIGKENAVAKIEQQYLVSEMESTISALEDCKEAAFQQRAFMLKVAMVLSHDLQSPFRFLVSGAASVHKAIGNHEYAIAAAQSKEVETSGEKMLLFLTDFTLWIKSVANAYQVNEQRVMLHGVLAGLADFFSEQLKDKHNTLVVADTGNIEVVTDAALLKIILRNIIDNANKYNSNTIIKIEVTADDQFATIAVCDNGCGMPPNVLQQVKETLKCQRTDAPVTADRQGFSFIGHFAALLDIDIAIASNQQAGTCVQLGKLKLA